MKFLILTEILAKYCDNSIHYHYKYIIRINQRYYGDCRISLGVCKINML